MTFNITFVEVGTKVYYPVPWERIVIPCIVVETNDIYPSGEETLWGSRFLNPAKDSPIGKDYISVPTGEKDKLGWNICKREDVSYVKDIKSCNQFVWLDEDTGGHEISVGDECFLTLHEALACIAPSPKKRLAARLRRHRSLSQKFVAKTHTMSGYPYPFFPKQPMKKVYVHRPHNRGNQ